MVKTQFDMQFAHHLVLKVCTVISENGAWYTKMSYDVVKKKQSCGTTIVQKGRHSLNPFFEIIDGNDDVTVPPG